MYDFFLWNQKNYGGYIGNHNRYSFSSGSGFILCKEACIYLTDNSKHNLDINYLDDVVIGNIIFYYLWIFINKKHSKNENHSKKQYNKKTNKIIL